MKNQKYFQLYIELKDYKPKMWRRFVIDSDIGLSDLAYIIMTIYEMKANHLFKFIKAIKQLKYLYELPMDMEYFHPNLIQENVFKTKLNQVISQEKDRIDFWYDFGDDWFFEIKLENIIELESIAVPLIIDGHGFGIIEDCGGVYELKMYKQDKIDIVELNQRLTIIPPIFKKIYEDRKQITQDEIELLDRL